MRQLAGGDRPRFVSRSFSTIPGSRPASCKRCGSSLSGRFEQRKQRTIAQTSYEIDIYRCLCGRGREVRRRL